MVGTPEFMAPEVVDFDDIAEETGTKLFLIFSWFLNTFFQINGHSVFSPSSFSPATPPSWKSPMTSRQ